MPSCFIAMPISTVNPANYAGDTEHFRHVMDYLFVPALEQVGYTPISPIAEGSEVVHADIIKHIEQADLVLCDMSTYNPNVFFELGIRTALNRPTCMVKDDLTPKSPFDTSMVNCHTYLGALHPWTLKEQIELLAKHIQKSLERSAGQNSMWKYFGLSKDSRVPLELNATDARIELLSSQLNSLLRQQTLKVETPNPKRTAEADPGEQLFHKLVTIASAAGVTIQSGGWDYPPRRIYVVVASDFSNEDVARAMQNEAAAAGFELTIHRETQSDS